jgi:hypothetical protein
MNPAPAFDCTRCGRRIGKAADHYIAGGEVLCLRCFTALADTVHLAGGDLANYEFGTRAWAALTLGLWPGSRGSRVAADQQAAAARERDRQEHQAVHGGKPVTVRTIAVEVTPEEAEALARGEVPPRIQAQLDRQQAEDETIASMEEGL